MLLFSRGAFSSMPPMVEHPPRLSVGALVIVVVEPFTAVSERNHVDDPATSSSGLS